MAETGASASAGPESTSMPLKRSRCRPRKDAQTQKVTDEVQGSRKDGALLKPPLHVLPTPLKSKECHSTPLQCQLYVAGDITDAASEDGCTMCCMTIQESSDSRNGQDALFCEGSCQKWYHRWCAGVCLEDFKILSNSSEPFFCTACTVRKQNDTISLLRSGIEVLKNEVIELRAVVTSLCSNVTPPDPTYLEAAQVQTKKSSSECSEPPRNVVLRRKNGRGKGGNGGSGGIGGSGGNGGSGGIVGNGGIGRSGGIGGSGGIWGSDRVNRDGQPRRVPVTGARKIWGTVKYATAASVTSTLKTLAKLPVDAVFVKRKYKTAQNNKKQVVRWWFVVRGDERVLKDLESNWGSVSIQTAWKLEPVMEFEATMSPTPQKQHTIPSDKRSEDLQASANMHTSETRVATKDILGSVAAVDPTHTDPHTETSSPLRSIPSQDREGVTH